ncbi:PREDICTED: uncharacterized protein LOC104755365 [Camelina sativa]|uniref:Uncharacterized protein LOC104755365 n=1 Tax=Camelina sativa TaxID=90675 RepID=A0ABM0WTR2_CAMSA|nr:PREDICTED: uncharacterized protein LOC104755365 [Camelina sativa]
MGLALIHKSENKKKKKKKVSSMISIKAALISTGIAAMSLFLKYSVPIAVDFSVSRFPILWSSFLSWLKPPYIFVASNVIITIIIAFSKFHQSIEEDQEEEGHQDGEILHCDEYESHQVDTKDVNLDADIDFAVRVPPPILVAEVERSEAVYEEKDEEINGGDELKSEVNQVLPKIEESENLTPVEKPLVSGSSGYRKPVKAISKGGNKKKKALGVVKPKRHETSSENTWKMVTEVGKSTSLTTRFRRSDTLGNGVGGDVKRPVLRKAETFRDVTNHRQSSSMQPVKMKMKKEVSPSRDELNRRVEAFIKKCKEERFESFRLEKEFVA